VGGYGFRQSAYLQELALYTGQYAVFDEASELLRRVGGVELSDKTIERLCHHYGELLEEEEVEDTPIRDIRPHYAMIDGSMILTREEKWKEMKLGRIFPFAAQIAESEKRNLILESEYVAHLGSHEAFFEKLYLQIAALTQVVFICDGAKWIWNWVEAHFPDAVQILDWFHVVEKISQFALLAFADKQLASQWIEEIKEDLWQGRTEAVLSRIRERRLKGKKAKEQQLLLGYLERNRKRIRYKTFREAGYHIGSGPIEAAHRHIIQKRLKLSGQRWSATGAQQVVNLRIAFAGRRPEKVTQLVRIAA
jgi:hypothetical protein